MAIDVTRARRLIGAAAVAGFALRLAFGFGYWLHKPLTHDEREYLALARSVSLGKGFVYDLPSDPPDAQRFGRAPGYPVFLALIGAGTGEFDATPARVKVAQSIVGALGVWLIGAIARRAAGPRAGVVAAAVAAVYPPLVWICAYVFSEALASTTALAAVLLLNAAIDRSDGILTRTRGSVLITAMAGVVTGIAMLIRPATAFFVPIAAIWLLARRRTVLAAIFAAGAVLVVAPWTIRNVHVYHRVVLIASEGGVTFWTGNHPLARGEGDMAANPDIKLADIAFRRSYPGLTPEELEPLYYREAIAYIAAHPLWWLGLLLKKAFYTVVPVGRSYALHSPLYRTASIASYLMLLPFGVSGRRDGDVIRIRRMLLFRWRHRPWSCASCSSRRSDSGSPSSIQL